MNCRATQEFHQEKHWYASKYAQPTNLTNVDRVLFACSSKPMWVKDLASVSPLFPVMNFAFSKNTEKICLT